MTRKILFAVMAVMAAIVVWLPASMSAMDSGVAGKWAFVLETEGGPREAPAEFTLDGTVVGGTWGKQPAKGTFKDGELSMEFDFDSDEVGKGVMKMVGKLDGDSLVGKWEFQSYNGTFKATRPTE